MRGEDAMASIRAGGVFDANSIAAVIKDDEPHIGDSPMEGVEVFRGKFIIGNRENR